MSEKAEAFRLFILVKRVTDRVGGAQRQVLIRCRAERARSAGGCESRSGFIYVYIYLDVWTDHNNGADVT